MIKSMTGYGSAKGQTGGLEITVELKSVNNRYLDTSVRLPRSFLFAEDAVKSAVLKGGDGFFTALGFHYFGPIDGHELRSLEKTLRLSVAVRV